MDNSDKQMEMLLEEGGIADDGMNVDPVSGNEIPPGSMANEVRDDVPAQLSEGEYVVPADVLRFYGVKFFEDLRSQAKQGLMEMESNGRIGGEPVMMNGSEGEDPFTPEEKAALESMGMAVGGMVPQPTQSTMPMQQAQMYQQPSPVAMGNVGYNKGGLETEDITVVDFDPEDYATSAQTEALTTAAFDPADYGRGSSIDRVLNADLEQAPALKTVTLYGPNGELRTLTLPVQQELYDQLVQEGYSEEQVATTTETTVGVDDDDDRGGEGTTSGPTGPSISEMSAEELGEAAKGLQAMDTVASVVSSFSPVVGLGIKGLSKAQENAINNRAEELGIESPLGKEPNNESFFSSIISDVTDFFTGKTKDVEDAPTVPTGSTSLDTPTGLGSTDDKSSGGRDLGADLGIGATSGVDTSSAAQEASDLGFGDVDTGEFGGMGSGSAPAGNSNDGTGSDNDGDGFGDMGGISGGA